MARDALEPGPGNTYPAFPRDSLGRPLWSDSAATDGVPVNGITPMPRGIRTQGGAPIDVTRPARAGCRSTRRGDRHPRPADLITPGAVGIAQGGRVDHPAHCAREVRDSRCAERGPGCLWKAPGASCVRCDHRAR